jgi:hypothetical protein
MNSQKNQYKVNGWVMRKDEETWEMKKEKFVFNLLHLSSLELEFSEINGDEQIEFMEGEISIQFNFPYFQIDSFEISNITVSK